MMTILTTDTSGSTSTAKRTRAPSRHDHPADGRGPRQHHLRGLGQLAFEQFALEFNGQVDQRHVDHRYPHGHAGELAGQFGQYQAHGFGGPIWL